MAMAGIGWNRDSGRGASGHRHLWNPRSAQIWVICAFALLLVLRVVRAFTLAPDTDEAQHLHVVWAWTQGLVVYRDVFDNHTPLFHLLCAPLLMLLGERADVIVWMRLAMIPLYFGALYATWRIGRTVWSSRVGLYAALLIGATPVFFKTATQFRTDDLWMLLWLCTVAVAVGRPFTRARAFAAGVLAGATFCVSAKTSLLLGTAALAGATVFALEWRRRAIPLAPVIRSLLIGALGAALVPAALAAYFLAHGAWDAAIYAVFQHNLVAGLGRWKHGDWYFGLFPVGYALATAGAAWWQGRAEPSAWRRGSWVLLSAIGYLLALFAYWPLITHQDLLPVLPLVALLPAALMTAYGEGGRRPSRSRFAFAYAPPALALSVVAGIVLLSPDRYTPTRDELASILSLTHPGDYVMDPKGDSIYRPRPFFWVLERVTEERLRNGSIRDDLSDRLAATSTAFLLDDHLPLADRAFVDANYLPIGGRLRVAGQHLGSLPAGRSGHFRIAIAGDYRFVDRDGAVAGWLDGARFVDGAVHLAAGEHRFAPVAAADLALVWAPALERGLSLHSLLPPNGPSHLLSSR